MRIQVGAQERRLKKDEAGNPYCCRSAQHRQKLLGRDRLHHKKQERAQKNRAAKQPPRTCHRILEMGFRDQNSSCESLHNQADAITWVNTVLKPTSAEAVIHSPYRARWFSFPVLPSNSPRGQWKCQHSDPSPTRKAPLDDPAIGASAQRKAALRLLPIISIGYGLAYMDRINISFASLRMNSDLHFSATVYGLGAGLFFIGYALCEVPSNLLLLRFGPKRWLARIMFTWGLLAAAMMFVRTPWQFYGVRLLLGMAEAGFFPAFCITSRSGSRPRMRARAVSRFYIALPLSSVLMGAVAGWLMGLQGTLGLAGWQWLFLVEGLPAALFSFVFLWMLPDGPMQAAWLTTEEKMWLKRQLEADSAHAHLGHEAGVMRALLSPKVWMIGAYFLCALTANYAYYFSAPAILQAPQAGASRMLDS